MGKVRIIGGECRGRFLHFAAADGLRPTGDRIRETLFNWLQWDIPAARVLDLYAGSGALGFEAASRGAASVDMIELNPQTFVQLSRQKSQLGLEQIDLHQGSALTFLQNSGLCYDVIFLDPPFHGGLLRPTLEALDRLRPFGDSGVIYLEFERRSPPALPAGWEFDRLKQSGDVGYGILRP